MKTFITFTIYFTLLFFLIDWIKMYGEYYYTFNEYERNIHQIRRNRLVRYSFTEPDPPMMPHDIIACLFLVIIPMFPPIFVSLFVLFYL